MDKVFPDYYSEFECIKDKCRHNCCIGWEIDIDEDTAELYLSTEGDFGKKLKENIAKGEVCHFKLKEDDRCPFLNENNLCEIIINLGKEYLCSICDLHPRFVNELPGRIETGLGLCCEAAATLILGRKDPAYLTGVTEETDDEIMKIRDRIITLLQDRTKAIPERIADIYAFLDVEPLDLDLSKWAEFLLSLERLDEKWTSVLSFTKNNLINTDFAAFDSYIIGRETEFEQLLVYFIYRHFANAPDRDEALIRAVFAIISYLTVYAVGAVSFSQKGSFDFEELCETARLYSSEIEYSEDNLYAVFDEISFII